MAATRSDSPRCWRPVGYGPGGDAVVMACLGGLAAGATREKVGQTQCVAGVWVCVKHVGARGETLSNVILRCTGMTATRSVFRSSNTS